MKNTPAEVTIPASLLATLIGMAEDTLARERERGMEAEALAFYEADLSAARNALQTKVKG